MARKLFGTDGVRGVFGERCSPRTSRCALGCAAALHIASEPPAGADRARHPRVRASCSQTRSPQGISAEGGDVLLGGVLPTPAAPLLIGRYGFDLAVVLSASHNPYRDNGIKFFAGDGYKLSDETESQIERDLDGRRRARRRGGAGPAARDRPHP